MTNLSDLLPAGAASKQLDFTASGAIAQGKAVILNTNGTASQIAADATSQSEAVGSEAVFESAETNHTAIAYGNGKLVIAYQDGGNSNYGTAVVATCSNGALTYGTPVVFESGSTSECGVAYDSSADKFVIGFKQSGAHVIVGSVSGTSISFGTKVQCSSATSSVEYSVITYDSTASKSIIAWVEGAGQDYGYARTVSVSGTTATVGAIATLTSEAVFQPAIAYDSTNDRVVYMYGTSNGGNGRVNLITVSGTTLTVVASGATFATNEITRSNRLVHDPSANRMFLAYRESSDIYGIIGTISGNSISFGSRVSMFTSATDINQTVSYHSIAEKVVFVSQKTGDALIAIPCAVSGTTFSKGSEVTLDAQAKDPASAYDENDKKIVVAFHDTPNNSYGTGISYTPAYTDTNLTATNFLGIADAAISNAASGKITMKGGIAANGLSGLTPNTIFHVQNDGSLAATNIPFDISGASYDSVEFSVSTQETDPTDLRFNTSGTKLFVIGQAGDDVNEYALSTAYNISTASYTTNFSVASQETAPRGLAFNSDGTKMYAVGSANDTVYQYSLSSAFDLSTASYDSVSFSVASQTTFPTAIDFNSDGTKMFIVGGGNVSEYNLSSAFVVSSATYSQNFSLSGSSQSGLAFNSDGTKMFVVDTGGDVVFPYTLSTGFDVSTASAGNSFSVSNQDTDPQGVEFNSDGTKMYIVGGQNDKVYQYSTKSASTTVVAGKAMSATSINLDFST